MKCHFQFRCPHRTSLFFPEILDSDIDGKKKDQHRRKSILEWDCWYQQFDSVSHQVPFLWFIQTTIVFGFGKIFYFHDIWKQRFSQIYAKANSKRRCKLWIQRSGRDVNNVFCYFFWISLFLNLFSFKFLYYRMKE